MTSEPSLAVAFKEWAAICRALDRGRQCLILRKGGIAEEGGQFRAEHPRFLLYPTHFHEQRERVKPEFRNDFEIAPPAAGTIVFTNCAEVLDVRYIADLDSALALDPLHAWTEDVVRQRFLYRTPGLFVLTTRIYRLPAPVIRPERPEYAGCKTWVMLDDPVLITGATPVLSDEDFARAGRRD